MQMKRNHHAGAFTLMETVIAIGVLAVLITAFLAVFGPATQGIRRAINVQDADRLVATLEKELSILRDSGSHKTAFDKAFDWIRRSNENDSLIMLYQYRGNPDDLRPDGTMNPYTARGGVAGRDYVVQSMARQRKDSLFIEDLEAIEGRVFVVKARQLVFRDNQLAPIDSPGQIQGMTSGSPAASSDDYPDAVIAFAAEFYSLPSNAEAYVKSGGTLRAENLTQPVFTRNLGVRR